MRAELLALLFFSSALSISAFVNLSSSSARRSTFLSIVKEKQFRLDSLNRQQTAMVLLPFVPSAALEALCVNSIGFTLFVASGKASKMLTTSGCVHSFVLANVLWYTLNWKGWSTCTLYLLAGSFVTKIKMSEKVAKGIAEGRGGRRGPENVWGSALTAALCALSTKIWPDYFTMLTLGFVASLATKLGDTFASEIGKAYGRTTYLITTLKKVPPGTEGAVSLEGTLAGIVGSMIISFYSVAIGLISFKVVGVCIFAAFIANNVESFLGATTQGKAKWLTNEFINFVNTSVGAVVAMGTWFCM